MRTTASSSIQHVFLLLIATLAACSAIQTGPAQNDQIAAPGEQVQEIMPGLLQGYLSEEEQLDSKAFVLPAPESDSALQALDTAWSCHGRHEENEVQAQAGSEAAQFGYRGAICRQDIRDGFTGRRGTAGVRARRVPRV